MDPSVKLGATVICKMTLDLLFENYDPEPDGSYILTDERVGEISEMIKDLRDEDGMIMCKQSDVIAVRYMPTLDTMQSRRNLVRLMQLAEAYAKVTLLDHFKSVPDLDLEKMAEMEDLANLDLGEFTV